MTLAEALGMTPEDEQRMTERLRVEFEVIREAERQAAIQSHTIILGGSA